MMCNTMRLKINNTAGIYINGDRVKAQFMYKNERYQLGTCTVMNTEAIENLLIMTQSAQDAVGKTKHDAHIEALVFNKKMDDKRKKVLYKRLRSSKYNKRNTTNPF